MKTLAVVIGKRSDSKFKQVIRDLKHFGFFYNPLSKEWSRKTKDEEIDHWVKQLKQAGLQSHIKE